MTSLDGCLDVWGVWKLVKHLRTVLQAITSVLNIQQVKIINMLNQILFMTCNWNQDRILIRLYIFKNTVCVCFSIWVRVNSSHIEPLARRHLTTPSTPWLSSQPGGSRRNNRACGCFVVSNGGERSGCGCTCEEEEEARRVGRTAHSPVAPFR